MKKVWLYTIFLSSGLLAVLLDIRGSVGARTEALFIIQNKTREVKEYIVALKKKLTDMHTQLQKPVRYTSWAERQFSRYQIEMRDLVFPSSIRELECLVGHLEKETAGLSEASAPEGAIQRVVDLATLLKKKIDFESHFLELLFALDKEENKIAHSKKIVGKNKRRLSNQQGTQGAKQALDKVRTIVAEVNDKLYSEMNCPGDRLCLDKLSLYKGRSRVVS